MLSRHGSAPKVVVVGGSLGGLFDAIAVRSLGWGVDVYEKPCGLMQDGMQASSSNRKLLSSRDRERAVV